MKIAFSTVACPEWTLERVASSAREAGYLGVELRGFGDASRAFASDPFLIDAAKVRRVLDQVGVRVASLATGVRYDAPINPPMVGHFLFDQEASVHAAKRAVDVAAAIEAPFVRVFGFEVQGADRPANALERIQNRLYLTCDHARTTGVQVVLENGGSFVRAADQAAMLDRVKHTLMRAAYSIQIGALAGDDPAEAVAMLGERLTIVKVRPYVNGVPAAVDANDPLIARTFARLREIGYTGWVVYELDRAWGRGQGPADVGATLKASAQALYTLATGPTSSRRPVVMS
jgi:sugar phosphate isomerase/epimerase